MYLCKIWEYVMGDWGGWSEMIYYLLLIDFLGTMYVCGSGDGCIMES